MKSFWTVEETAKELSLSEEYIRHNIRKGKLKAYKLGRRWIVFIEDVNVFIKTHGQPNQLKIYKHG